MRGRLAVRFGHDAGHAVDDLRMLVRHVLGLGDLQAVESLGQFEIDARRVS